MEVLTTKLLVELGCEMSHYLLAMAHYLLFSECVLLALTFERYLGLLKKS